MVDRLGPPDHDPRYPIMPPTPDDPRMGSGPSSEADELAKMRRHLAANTNRPPLDHVLDRALHELSPGGLPLVALEPVVESVEPGDALAQLEASDQAAVTDAMRRSGLAEG